MTLSLRYEGALSPTVLSGRVRPAMPAPPAFDDEGDYAKFARLGPERWTAPLLGYAEKYEVLAALLRAVRAHCGDTVEEILVTSRMPSTCRMPDALLSGRIFFVVDLEAEAAALEREERRFIALHEGFVRTWVESGDNEFILDWRRAPPDGRERLEAMRPEFEAAGLATRAIRSQVGEAASCI